MGIRGKFIVVISVIAVAVGISSFVLLERSHDGLIEQEAVRIAEIVSTQVICDRAEYTQNLVGKLKKDGTGAARNSQEKEGFIQLPAQFVRNVSKRVASQANGLYAYSLVSEWNLNQDQGLKNEFDRWAWSMLNQQDTAFAQNGTKPGTKGYEWKPAYRFENVDGRQVLHYMKADPASAASCVSCHNAYEQKPDVIAMRKAAGVAPGKTWNRHQLMGAIKVEVPVDEVAAAAAAGRNNMLAGIGAVFVIGFGLLFGLIRKTIINPVETSVREVEGFSSKIDSVVGCSRHLLLGADEQTMACKKAKTTSVVPVGVGGGGDNGGGDAHEGMAESLDGLTSIANENAKRAEESAVYCTDLDDSFGQLKERLQNILGQR